MFLASNPTKCRGSRVPGTGKIFLFILIIFSAPGFLLSIYLNILLLNSGIAALGVYVIDISPNDDYVHEVAEKQKHFKIIGPFRKIFRLKWHSINTFDHAKEHVNRNCEREEFASLSEKISLP